MNVEGLHYRSGYVAALSRTMVLFIGDPAV